MSNVMYVRPLPTHPLDFLNHLCSAKFFIFIHGDYTHPNVDP